MQNEARCVTSRLTVDRFHLRLPLTLTLSPQAGRGDRVACAAQGALLAMGEAGAAADLGNV
jgi:hypothetical protein